MKTLVVGCDASGKSTFIEGINGRHGDVFAESTQTARAQEFKRKYFGHPVDAEFIDARESMYLDLSGSSMKRVMELEGSGLDTITSDSSLVTRLSHAVMREVRLGVVVSDEEVISKWANNDVADPKEIPDIAVLTSPPFSVIVERMRARQAAGDRMESFVGFNSLDFLEAYHDRWEAFFPRLVDSVPLLISVDTSQVSVGESIDVYSQMRQEMETK